MENVVLVIHLIFALAIIGLVLLQRSEGGGLGAQVSAAKMTAARHAASALTRATAICAALFFTTSLILGVMAGRDSMANKSILDSIAATPAPVEAPASVPEAPPAGKPPAAPIAK